MKKSKQDEVTQYDEFTGTPENRVTIEDAINDYMQTVNSLETLVQDLSKALVPVLIEAPKPVTLPDSRICSASLRCKDILALNEKLSKINLTVHNLIINLGV